MINSAVPVNGHFNFYNHDFSEFANEIRVSKYSHGGTETWRDTANRVSREVMGAVDAPQSIVKEIGERIYLRQFMPGGRYLFAAGRPFHQTQNCLLLRPHDSREGWAELMSHSAMGLMTGAGIGAEYSAIRPKGKPIRKIGGTATGPIALMNIINECGRGIRQGGSRRSALWAGLQWDHGDTKEFIHLKDWPDEVKELKARDFNSHAPMDGTNISVGLNDEFFQAYHNPCHSKHELARVVYWDVIRQMLSTGEPGFSINVGPHSREILRNACTEVSSEHDSDICNLGSINLARVSSRNEMRGLVELATMFLLAGTVYSHVPYHKVDEVRTLNRRLGLGLMGIHEWLLQRGERYGPSVDLSKYLGEYSKSTSYSNEYADQWGLSRPVKTRAIAPTGTISIVAETTSGCEPIFCSAYKRRYLNGEQWNYQYVLDPTAKRIIEGGNVDPDSIEDAYSIESDRRVDMQVWLQGYVDHGISSTINLPAWGSPANNQDTVQGFGEMLLKRLPHLRGITCYPDGARGGQPLTTVPYREASKHTGEIFVEAMDVCDRTRSGMCGA